MRWRLIVPVIGLTLFAGITVESLHRKRSYQKDPSRYLYWSSIRLDSNPLKMQPQSTTPCKDVEESCVGWDPVVQWVSPGLLPVIMMVSAWPVFFVGMRAVRALGHHGISEISSFMVVMPLLVAVWYYAIGWSIDRWKEKQSRE
jgi:hypothetical protein